jgi:CheY-like chemotaxis protein
MGLVETILEAGRYDIVFVESSAHAYSRIKLVHPSLVVLCVSVDDLDGFRVLSMLKLDNETRHIPILTYSTDYERRGTSADDTDTLTAEALSCNSARWMN